jgi:hypothetical protein
MYQRSRQICGRLGADVFFCRKGFSKQIAY